VVQKFWTWVQPKNLPFRAKVALAALKGEHTIMQEMAPSMQSGEDIARYGECVLERAQVRWRGYPERSCGRTVDTYFGKQPLHIVHERTVWHPAQHTRQLMLILDIPGIEPDGRLAAGISPGCRCPKKPGTRTGRPTASPRTFA